jgi:hypothetical protein
MKLKSLFMALALAVGSLSTQAATYSFSQTGFTGGGLLSGSFSGADINLDGILDFSANEISAFSLSFTGGTSVSAFTLGYGDLFGLVFKINAGNFIGDDTTTAGSEGIGAFNDQYTYVSGVGPMTELGLGGGQGALIMDASSSPLTSSTSVIEISPVPEPESYAMLLAGLGMMGFVARRRAK